MDYNIYTHIPSASDNFINNTPDHSTTKTENKEHIDHVGKLSPFRDYVNNKDSNTKGLNTFNLSDYVWYPESILTKSRDDYFETLRLDKTSLDDNDSGLFDGVSLGDLKNPLDVVNKTISYAYSQGKGVVDSVTGLFKKGEDDVLKDNLTTILEGVPHIILYEFKPNSIIGSTIKSFRETFNKFDSFFKENGFGDAIDNITDMFESGGLIKILSDLTGKSIDTSTSYSKVVDIPNFFYMNLIGGYYTGQYTFPFFEQKDYLHGMGDNGWNSKSLKQRILPGGISGIADGFSSLLSAYDIASRPKWSMDGSGPSGDEITFELNLFNHDHESLIKNIIMLHSLASGNMWTQSVFLQLSPSLYDIEIPGRYRYFFCKADTKIEFIGKQRKPTQKFKDELSSIVAFDNLVDDVSYNFNEDSFKFIPDGYKLIIKFTSLIPNNFNSYLNYLIKNEDDISVGDSKLSIGNKMVSGIADGVIKKEEEIQIKIDNTVPEWDNWMN